MNKPEEIKAKELVEKYLDKVNEADRYNYLLDSEKLVIAKQCAIICCDEIIRIQNYYDERGEEINFWQSVRSHIEKIVG